MSDERKSTNYAPTAYTRPKGVMGGPCLHCSASQPEHVGKTCDEVRAARSASMRKLLDKAKVDNKVLAHVRAQDFGVAPAAPGYGFGLLSAAAALRALADNIEAQRVVPHHVEMKTEAAHDDFHFTTLTFRYCEKVKD